MNKLTQDDINWIKRAIELDMTRLMVKKKLQESKYPDDKIDAFLDYYDVLLDKKNEIEESVNIDKGSSKAGEKVFEESVKDYFGDNKKNLSRKEKKDVKNFLKQCSKYSKMMKQAIEGFKKELIYINSQNWNKDKIVKEMNYLCDEIRDRLIESKPILEIENPVTHEEIDKENLKKLDINTLINLMEENVESLDLIVNGKITE